MSKVWTSIGIRLAISVATAAFKYLAKKQKRAFNAMLTTIAGMTEEQIFGNQVTINEQYRESLCTAIEDGKVNLIEAAEVVKFVKYIYANAKLGTLTEEIKLVGAVPDSFVDIVLENKDQITSLIYKLTKTEDDDNTAESDQDNNSHLA